MIKGILMQDQGQAKEMALQLFIAMSQNEQIMRGFFLQTGYSPDDIRTQVDTVEFLGAILEFLMGWEDALITICQVAKIDPSFVAEAHHALLGPSYQI